MVLCTSPEYLREHGTPTHPAELSAHAIMAYTPLSMGEVWEFSGSEGAVSVKVSPNMRSNNGDTCCAAALAHRGIVLQPSFLVAQHIASGALVEVLSPYRSHEFAVYAVYPSCRHVTPKVRLLVDFLIDTFRNCSWD